MKKWRCIVCSYVYDPAAGDPDHGIPPGTPFEKLPDDWTCPDCGAEKSMFEPMWAVPPVEIASGIRWVGVLHPQLRVFDVIMRAEHGTSYNSFLVEGSKRVAHFRTRAS